MAVKRTIACIFISLAAVIFSCEEKSDLVPRSENTDLIAVEGVITNENINHIIRLSLPYKNQNGRSVPVNNANVSISDGTTSIQLLRGDSGTYSTPKMRFVSGKNYVLTFSYNGKQFTAHDSSLPVESLPALSYASAENGYRFNFFDTGTQPHYIEYYVNWEGTSSCLTGCKAKLIYYDLKTVDTHEIFKPEKTDFIFPHGSTIIRRKFSASAEYRSFLRSMLSETEWRGGVFDIQRDNAPTNLSEGAIGFFAVSTVVSDTLKIQ